MHPKVQSGEMTEAEVFGQFLQNFGDKNKDGMVDRKVIFVTSFIYIYIYIYIGVE